MELNCQLSKIFQFKKSIWWIFYHQVFLEVFGWNRKLKKTKKQFRFSFEQWIINTSLISTENHVKSIDHGREVCLFCSNSNEIWAVARVQTKFWQMRALL